MDNLTKEQRKLNMSRIRSKDTGLEKPIFSLLRRKGLIFTKHHHNLPGKPDIVVSRYKVAVFLDSDFWHGWYFPRWRHRLPRRYWRNKIEKNIGRDKKNFSKLRKMNWEIVRIWGHQIKKNPERCVGRILEAVSKRKRWKEKAI